MKWWSVLKQAKDIFLGEMNKALSKSREDVLKMEKITVDKKDIATVIEKGGNYKRNSYIWAKVINDEGEVK